MPSVAIKEHSTCLYKQRTRADCYTTDNESKAKRMGCRLFVRSLIVTVNRPIHGLNDLSAQLRSLRVTRDRTWQKICKFPPRVIVFTELGLDKISRLRSPWKIPYLQTTTTKNIMLKALPWRIFQMRNLLVCLPWLMLYFSIQNTENKSIIHKQPAVDHW